MNKGNILDPSSGAIGIRLNRAKTIFIKTKNIIALLNNSGILKGAIIENLNKIEPIVAKKILEAGPAIAINIISFLGLERLRIFTGTGLAQPNPKKYNAIVPIGSK
jgi:hypothetical protein